MTEFWICAQVYIQKFMIEKMRYSETQWPDTSTTYSITSSSVFMTFGIVVIKKLMIHCTVDNPL